MKYRAFISYSHRDKTWGDWLHKGLEQYRVPKPLVGLATERGEPVPARIFPVFRDREELPTAVDLGEIINAALAESRYLIVICSPASAKSQWVNEEILQFKRLGGESRVLAIIVEGEPNASEGKPGFTADQECFPPALRYKLGADGELSTARTEPIAADARPHADGKTNALLKLAAGVLGVNYDDLKRRDEAHRRRRQRIALAVVSSLAIVISALAIIAWVQRGEALKQTARADEKAIEAGRERNVAIKQRQEAEVQRNRAIEQTAKAEFGLAKLSLSSGQAPRAAIAALSAIEQSEKIQRPLEDAWWVLRRALEADRVEHRWKAHSESVDESGFDESGTRLLTFSRADGEARLWSVADGRLLATIAPGAGTQLAGWNGPDEVVTVHSSERKTGGGYFAEWEYQTTLAWWKADGTKLREHILPGCTYSSMDRRPTHGCPPWIEVTDRKKNATRLVRLRDGWSELSIPRTERAVKFIPECAVVLAVQPSGVRVYSLENGRELGGLEGVAPAQGLTITSTASSTDGGLLAATVEVKDEGLSTRVEEVGVWRAADGSRVFRFVPPDEQKKWPHGISNVGGQQLAGEPEAMLAPIAAQLGLKPRRVSPRYTALAWHKGAKRLSILAKLDYHGSLAMELEGEEDSISLETEPAKTQTIALLANGELLASGDDRGEVRLWRTARQFAAHDLPDGLTLAQTAESRSAPGNLVLEGSAGQLLLWDVAAERLVATIPGTQTDRRVPFRYVWPGSDEWLARIDATVLPIKFFEVDEEPADSRQATFYHPRSGKVLGQRSLRFGLFTSTHSPHAVSWGTGWELLSQKDGALVVTALERKAGVAQDTRTRFAFAEDGHRLFAVTADGWLLTFATDTGKITRAFRCAEDLGKSRLRWLTVSPSGGWALVEGGGANQAHPRLINLSTEESKDVPSPDHTVNFEILEDESLLVHHDNEHTSWLTFPELVPVAKVRGGYSRVSRISNSDLLLLGTGSQRLVADSKTGREIARYDDVLDADAALGIGVSSVGIEGVRVFRLSDGEVLAEGAGYAASAAIRKDGSAVDLVRTRSNRLSTLPLTTDRARLRAAAERMRAREARDRGEPENVTRVGASK